MGQGHLTLSAPYDAHSTGLQQASQYGSEGAQYDFIVEAADGVAECPIQESEDDNMGGIDADAVTADAASAGPVSLVSGVESREEFR